MSFVHAAVPTPPSSLWHRGEPVRNDRAIAAGTVIATFDPGGRYGNHLDGRSHAAIYIGQNALGLLVLDQWRGRTSQPVHERLIRFKGGHGSRVDDGDAFDVAE